MKSKIALGVITNDFTDFSPYLDFLTNAQKYGHNLTDIIVAYSNHKNNKIVSEIKQKVNLHLIKINDDPQFYSDLKLFGLTEEEIIILSHSKFFKKYDLIPYGKRRNCVLMKALMLYPDIDYLFFIDTDVQPFILQNAEGKMQEIDFFGRHLTYLKRKNVLVTTSDYSGYYIIPPMDFPGLQDLLVGLQKEDMYGRVIDLQKNLVTSRPERRMVKKTNKILGGNHALDLHGFRSLPPYYSTVYKFNGEPVLGRGEDTLLGLEIPQKNKYIFDIDTLIFHDTFSNFPNKPDIEDINIQNRFYYACLGWLGRNPFLNWVLKENKLLSAGEYKKQINRQKNALKNGSIKVADYLGNKKFAELPLAFDQAYSQLEDMVKTYRRTRLAWNSILDKIEEGSDNDENIAG